MTRAAHVHRPVADNGRRKRAGTPAADYPPGYFTALVRQHNWPPMWQPATLPVDRTPRHIDMSAEALRRRSESVGWGSGTIVLPGTPVHKAPGPMAGAQLAPRSGGKR